MSLMHIGNTQTKNVKKVPNRIGKKKKAKATNVHSVNQDYSVCVEYHGTDNSATRGITSRYSLNEELK